MQDVEANTVRLKEHGQDVLILEKIPIPVDTNGSFHSEYKWDLYQCQEYKNYLMFSFMPFYTRLSTAHTFGWFLFSRMLCPSFARYSPPLSVAVLLFLPLLGWIYFCRVIPPSPFLTPSRSFPLLSLPLSDSYPSIIGRQISCAFYSQLPIYR